MSKEYIFTLVIFLVLVASAVAVDRFYFREVHNDLEKDRSTLADLEKRLKTLEDTFNRTRPEEVIKAWKGEVEPWRTAVNMRTAFFRMKDAFKFNPIPVEAIPRFYYETEYSRMINEIEAEIFGRNPPPEDVPYDFIAREASAPGTYMSRGGKSSRNDIEEDLRSIAYRGYVLRTLLDLGFTRIYQLEAWPPRNEYGEMVEMWTLGLSTQVTLRELVECLEKMRKSDHYLTVNGIRITNAYLLSPSDPFLQVDMLITQGQFVEKAAAPSSAAEEGSVKPNPTEGQSGRSGNPES